MRSSAYPVPPLRISSTGDAVHTSYDCFTAVTGPFSDMCTAPLHSFPSNPISLIPFSQGQHDSQTSAAAATTPSMSPRR